MIWRDTSTKISCLDLSFTILFAEGPHLYVYFFLAVSIISPPFTQNTFLFFSFLNGRKGILDRAKGKEPPLVPPWTKWVNAPFKKKI